MIHAVMSWLREQEMGWYREGMHALLSQWCKAVDVYGDCGEITCKGNMQLNLREFHTY